MSLKFKANKAGDGWLCRDSLMFKKLVKLSVLEVEI